MALVIAGERSGVGKTTVTLALLSSLCRKSQPVQSFKVGPDYIDPMFHSRVTGRPCRNLDPILTSVAYVQDCFTRHQLEAEYALVEGVMGLFDGVSQGNCPNFASTAHIARLLNLPILLVIDCSRLSGSVAAIAHGYRTFDERLNFAGLVLNRVGSDRHLELLKEALEPLNFPILGVIRRQDGITIRDRHLGLVPTEELTQFQTIIDQLADLGDACFDWEQLLPLLKTKRDFPLEREVQPFLEQCTTGNSKSFLNPAIRRDFNSCSPQDCGGRGAETTLRIAIARDRAFNFYYQDNLDLLQQLGAELVFWSPLSEALPTNIQGLYFGGGFPEVFASELAQNTLAKKVVKAAILRGIPTYAECGGLMYLCEEIMDFEEKSWEMVGIFPAIAVMGSRLTLGYRQAIAQHDTILFPQGAIATGHEFHRSQLSQYSPSPLYEMRGYSKQSEPTLEGWYQPNIHASYLHLHWGDRPEIPARFLNFCREYL